MHDPLWSGGARRPTLHLTDDASLKEDARGGCRRRADSTFEACVGSIASQATFAYHSTAAVCPLCAQPDPRPLATVQGRAYLRCDSCGLAFMHPRHHISPEAERAHYATHENGPHDPRYRAFLSRLADPLVERLRPGTEGLDYGSGPGPTLSVMLAERGFRMRIYDPFFAPDADPLARTYDFVTCSETAEHFHDPRGEFARLHGLLRPGGWLGVMTQVLTDESRFATWAYVLDPTHVCFYSADTMRWIAGHFGLELEMPLANVALFRKP